MMRLLPTGLLGLVFAALIAAIIASTASKINSIATIFTLDIYAKMRPARGTAGEQADGHGVREQHLVKVGRIAAVVAIVIAVLTAVVRCFSGSFGFGKMKTAFRGRSRSAKTSIAAWDNGMCLE